MKPCPSTSKAKKGVMEDQRLSSRHVHVHEHTHTHTHTRTHAHTSRSSRPGRRSAGSMALGRLVAATTTTRRDPTPRCDSPRTPSISVNSCATTRDDASPVSSRRGHSASTSSRNTTATAGTLAGLASTNSRARRNTPRNRASDSPGVALITSAPFTGTIREWATCRASSRMRRTINVLPTPAGPCSSTPV